MSKKAAETFESVKVMFDFAISMAKDVKRFLKEEKNASDFRIIVGMLN